MLCFLELYVYKSPLVHGGGSRGGWGKLVGGGVQGCEIPHSFQLASWRLRSCKSATAPQAATEQGKFYILQCRSSMWPMYLTMWYEGN